MTDRLYDVKEGRGTRSMSMQWTTPHFELALPAGWRPHPHADAKANAKGVLGAVSGRHELVVASWLMHHLPGQSVSSLFAALIAHRRSVLVQGGASPIVELPVSWREGDAMSVLYGSLPDRHFHVTMFALESGARDFHTIVSASFYRHAPIRSYEELGELAQEAMASLSVNRS